MLSHIEEVLLLLSFFCLMIGIGASIEKQDVLAVIRDKKSLAVGLGLQYLLLPALAFALTFMMGLNPLIAGTLLLVAACPGGATSNMFTYFSKANVSLSLFMTFLTTLLASFMTPLLLLIYGAGLAENARLQIPLPNLVMTLAAALIPVLVGFAVRARSVKWALRLEAAGSMIGYISIAIMMVIWYPKMKEIIQNQDMNVFFSAGALSFLGILGSLLIAKMVGLSTENARTLSFETGIQNAPLAFAIISLNLPKEIILEIGWVPLLYGALSVGNAMLYTVAYRFFKVKQVTLS